MFRTTSAAAVCLALFAACSSDEERPPPTVPPTGPGTSVGGSGATGGSGGTGAGTATGGGGAGAGAGGGFEVLANCDPPNGASGALTTVEVETGLSQPMLVTYAPGEPDRIYIAERSGRILVKEGDQPATTFVDIDAGSATVELGGERGLLGLAFHPDYSENGRFFVHYSAPGGDLDHRGVVAEYQRDPDNPLLALPEPVREIVAVDQEAGNHNGGSIAFSPVDGLLHWALGDGGGANDTYDHGQNTQSLLATIVRLDVDAGTPFAVPPGNLDANLGDERIWQWGLRNPFRVSFDVCTGDLYVGDVGQNLWEEIDVVPAGAPPGNWGWPIMEGNSCFQAQSCDTDGLILPAHDYEHTNGDPRSVTGGAVYRGSDIPWLRGTYFFGDFVTQQMWTMRWTPSDPTPTVQEVTDDLYDGGGVAVSAVGQDARGELYVVDYGAGRILRIAAE